MKATFALCLMMLTFGALFLTARMAWKAHEEEGAE